MLGLGGYLPTTIFVSTEKAKPFPLILKAKREVFLPQAWSL